MSFSTGASAATGAGGSPASNPNYLMAASMGLSAVSSLTTGYAQSQAMEAQGDYQRRMAGINEGLAEDQARDALRRGDIDATTAHRRGNQMRGAQRANLAAQGLDVDSGSAADVQNETSMLSALDALTIKNNAMREAFGFRSQALNYRGQGELAEIGASNNARNTLLTGGLQGVSYGLQSGYYAMGGGREKEKGGGSGSGSGSGGRG